MIAGKECPLCGGEGSFIGEKNGHALRECCGVLLSWPWESVQQYENFYRDDYHDAEMERNGYKSFFSPDRHEEFRLAARARWREMSDLFPLQMSPVQSKILDVGAGAGAFVKTASFHGYFAVGLDISSRMAAFSSGFVGTGSWKNVDGEWDRIVMHDVVEHLCDPVECLSHLREHLRPDGILVVETPEWNESRGIGWKHVKPKEHLCLYSKEAAATLFERAGLCVLAARNPAEGPPDKITFYLIPNQA